MALISTIIDALQTVFKVAFIVGVVVFVLAVGWFFFLLYSGKLQERYGIDSDDEEGGGVQ